jgi:two-component system chemotaxis response regulator CheB
MGRIRVLVVDDSLTVRKRLVGILSADPEIELVGEAEDGKSAIEICQRTRPDIVTLDMMLPVMTGLAATEYIMAYCPTPILVVSSSTNRGELFRTYEALAAGAVDVLEKPDGSEADGEWERKFLASVRLVSRIRVITHPRGRLAEIGKPSLRTTSHPVDRAAMGHKYMIAAIGASTGGPGAIVNVLANLPATFQLPIIFVLHINEPFGTAFADWLDGQTSRRVGYPKDGDLVEAATGRVVMAPAGQHLIVRDGRFRLTLDAERHSCRPSVDVLFESVAREYGVAAVACLLTGMGKDGAIGLLQIRQAGGLTIAQNEATSVIYGMPREAVILGAARHILPVDEIGPLLTSLPTGGRG